MIPTAQSTGRGDVARVDAYPYRRGMLEEMITPAEIEQDRSPDDFISWFEGFLESTRADRSNRNQILLRQGIAKPLYEEVFPLYRLLTHKRVEWRERLFRNVLGNQPYDAVMTVPRSCSSTHLEITVADVDQAEAVRMEAFVARGRVPAVAPVTWTGTKQTGRAIEISEDMVLHDDVVRKKRDQIISAVERKSRRASSGNTALLVYFDDYTAFADQGDLPAMREALSTVRPAWQSKFTGLYVVGASGERFWEEQAPESPRLNSEMQ